MTAGKLGRCPGDPSKPALRAGAFLTGVLPAHPPTMDDMATVSFGLDNNDQYGTCVPTGLDNLRRAVTKLLTGVQKDASWQDVMTWYRSQNPNFDPAHYDEADDQGMIIQDFLSWAVKQGIILGFAKLDVADDEELQAAAYLGLGILWGVDLEVAQQSQTDRGLWDYQRSGKWGGHCVLMAAYESNDQQDVVTWAERVRTTDAFRRHQLDEAWMVILAEHAQHPDFRAGFDLPKFAAAYTQITGRPFPTVPPVDPPQPPTPGAASFPGATPAVDSRIARAALRAKLSTSEWMNRHFESYFNIKSGDEPRERRGMKIFGREPAAYIAVIQAILAFLLTLNVFGLTNDSVANIMAVVFAVSAVLEAWTTRDTLLSALVGLSKAVLALAVGYGLPLNADQVGALLAAVSIVLGLFLRTQTSPVNTLISRGSLVVPRMS